MSETIAGVPGLPREVILQMREMERSDILRPMTIEEVQAISLYLINNPGATVKTAYLEMRKHLSKEKA